MASPTTNAAPVVTIFGGSGFLGRYIAQRMARRGWRVRVAVRRPHEAHFVRPYGEVGQVQPVQANIRDDASTRRAIGGADAVINCVGILAEDARQKFDAVQSEGAGRIARLAAECGVTRLVHVSAIGADAESDSDYARSKAAGEAAVREAFPEAVILRPSIMFGTEDQFFNRFAAMAQFSPVLPLVGADTRFQPVYVDDVAEAACRAAAGEAEAGAAYELGGPAVRSFRELMRLMLKVVRRRRFIIGVPWGPARLMAWMMDAARTLSFGLLPAVITRDQVRQLRRDNVVSEGAKTLSDLGIEPQALEGVLESYLYAYRPHGQYEEITSSAKNIKA